MLRACYLVVVRECTHRVEVMARLEERHERLMTSSSTDQGHVSLLTQTSASNHIAKGGSLNLGGNGIAHRTLRQRCRCRNSTCIVILSSWNAWYHLHVDHNIQMMTSSLWTMTQSTLISTYRGEALHTKRFQSCHIDNKKYVQLCPQRIRKLSRLAHSLNYFIHHGLILSTIPVSPRCGHICNHIFCHKAKRFFDLICFSVVAFRLCQIFHKSLHASVVIFIQMHAPSVDGA